MRNFALGLLSGFSATVGAIAVAFVGVYLFWPAHLPAPAISNYATIDEKLRFIRERPDIDPSILVVGSSIAWRQITGPAFAELAGDETKFLNGGFVHLKIHQTKAFVQFYLANFNNVRTVVLPTAINDFEDCTAEPEILMDHEDATGYSFKRYPAALYYIKNFAPQRYLNSGLTLPERKTPFYGDMYIDRFGAGPIMLPEGVTLGLRYGDAKVDPACVDRLIDLSREVTDRGLKMVIVFAPVHPEYWRRFPTSHLKMRKIIADTRLGLQASDTMILDMHQDARFGPTDFFDAYHLSAPNAERLSALIVREAGAGKSGPGNHGLVADQAPHPTNEAVDKIVPIIQR